MCKHVKLCWGNKLLMKIDEAADLDTARDVVKKFTLDGSISTVFKRKGNRKITYSSQPHMMAETRYEFDLLLVEGVMTRSFRIEIIHWVAENLWPYEIVKDCSFQSLIKTGRPAYYLPHPSTVSQDVKTVFVHTWNRVAKIL